MSIKIPIFPLRTLISVIIACLFLFTSVHTALANVPVFNRVSDVVTGQSPTCVAAADLNGDGFDDLLTTNTDSLSWPYDNCLFAVCLGNGDGTFQEPITYVIGDDNLSWPFQIAVADLNGDSNLDAAIAVQNDNIIAVLLGNGDGTFGSIQSFAAGAYPEDVVADDFNSDGIMDLVVAKYDTDTVAVLFGTEGSFGFTAPVYYHTANYSFSLTSGDFNLDNHLDLAVSNYASHKVSVLINDGSGVFGTPSDYVVPYNSEVTCADFNADNKPDLAVGGREGVYVLLGNGDGTFSAPVPYGSPIPLWGDRYEQSVTAVDFNGDGKPDLAALKAEEDNIPGLSVFPGNGDGTFQAEASWRIAPAGVYNCFHAGSLAVGNFNNDLKPDLAVVNYEILNSISIFINTTLSGANDITSFSLAEQTGPATIDNLNHTVTVTVASGTDVTSLTPSINVSPGASISPASGAAVNFSSPVQYALTAEDGSIQDWTATVIVESPITRIAFDQSLYRIKDGDSCSFKIIASHQDGSTTEITDQAEYRSLINKIASADETGIISGLDPGITLINARYLGFSANAYVIVTAVPEVKLLVTPFNMSLQVGDSHDIKAVTLPKAEVSYASSDETVAIVDDDGVVTAVAEGSATISVTAARAGYKPGSASVEINVISAPACTITGIAFDSKLYSLDKGESINPVILATCSDGSKIDVTAEVSIRSANSNIVAVNDSGTVTGVRSGSTLIYARYGNYHAQAFVRVNYN